MAFWDAVKYTCLILSINCFIFVESEFVLERPNITGPIYVEYVTSPLSCEVNVPTTDVEIILYRWDNPHTYLHTEKSVILKYGQDLFTVSHTYYVLPTREMNEDPFMSTYTCDITYREQRENNTRRIYVFIKPEEPIILSATVIDGAEAELKCKSIDGLPGAMLSWLIGGVFYKGEQKEIKNNEGTVDVINTVKILFRRKDHEKRIVCEMAHAVPNAEISTAVSLEVIDQPDILLIHKFYNTTIGKNVTLMCIITTTDKRFFLRWTKDTETLNTSSKHYLDGDRINRASLTILSSQYNDSGVYKCIPSINTSLVESEKITLRIEFAPQNTKTIPENNITLKHGEAAVIRCLTEASPDPSVGWYYNGRRITTDGVLNVTSATSNINGPWLCKVSNYKGEVIVPFNLSVEYAPESNQISDEYMTQVGDNFTLVCDFHANPPEMNYSWWFYDAPLTIKTRTLTFIPVTNTSFGRYSCMAINAAGSSKPIEMKIFRKGEAKKLESKKQPVANMIGVILLAIIIITQSMVLILVCCIRNDFWISYRVPLLRHKRPSSSARPMLESISDVETCAIPVSTKLREMVKD